MDSISGLLIGKALDGLATRYAATAQNIANAGSTNYRPIRVRFEEALKAAASDASAIAAVAPETEVAHDILASDDMRLDLEIATASQTAGRYSALIEMLGREMQISRAVLGQG